MKIAVRKFLEARKTDYSYRAFTASAVSALFGTAFALYNGFLGVYYLSVWNGSICVYYLLMTTVRLLIADNLRKALTMPSEETNRHVRKIYYFTHGLMLLMNVSLIVPIAVMIKGERSYKLGLIPAIAIAAYTTYRIVSAVRHYSKSGKVKNFLVKELRTVNLIDTLVSVLTLQNTMLIANDGRITENMRTLSIITSTAIWLLIAVLTVLSFRYSRRADGK